MRTRVLPVEEWPRLKGTDAEALWPTLDPEKTAIVVVEDQGVIVAHHVLMFVLHAEALWVHPDYRHGLAGGRLWHAVTNAVRAVGVRGLMTAAIDDGVRDLIAHVKGTPIPGSHYFIPVEER
jgi:hypothetical protein